MDVNTHNVGALILAAGKGSRMHSPLPKVLHSLLGETMLDLVINALKPIFPKNIRIVIGHQAELVKSSIRNQDCRFITQEPQLGTGHALLTAMPALRAAGMEYILVVNGDAPLLKTERINWFLNDILKSGANLAFMTMTIDLPGSYGRVIRHDGKVTGVLEAKDYDPLLHGQESDEINTGVYLLHLNSIEHLLKKITCENNNNEYYITDLIALAATSGLRVTGLDQGNEEYSLLGVNTPAELIRSEETLRAEIVATWLRKGALVRNPASVRIGPEVTLEPGCELCGPCELYGKSSIACGARLESHTWAKDVRIGAGSVIRSFCHLEKVDIEPDCTVGPFARLRPGTTLESGARAGNFVEMKNARLGKGAKAGHLSYIGDADVGLGANIGAGAITCNYDGKNKFRTHIGAGAFIGSNSSLVAPVNVGAGALVGAGSVITKNVPENHLAVARSKQKNIPGRGAPAHPEEPDLQADSKNRPDF
ncbi:MAG: bifunctional UDP-N-acetylglucosamine diphosphorylase/glucosamine-1-phosphate N-acetyltransferase GlmU [Deltaproteobacteria bacterium]|jgi:bifunctional UDP-N-acetylglucosamine pyrophosphorylase/glucosamine-1-phosphate N-acetyltransferase|nr:bifunctional UDP-N-acetylglucosamine diphosphorylase/glucosamine-1-phosphate N-acetyltransferase GlmU [Deltaproteobacteria bacterium]